MVKGKVEGIRGFREDGGMGRGGHGVRGSSLVGNHGGWGGDDLRWVFAKWEGEEEEDDDGDI